ncbi:MAG: hypothetical protein COB43_11695 [Oceanospirillales bacterium]|nr:MAG: hypothetical protein COB43_11695 [Oceanospirillales bacterium]|tara:strand:+ start:1356 stop:2516 length:1161 start_codon:yes stop_codon:yes gene_type:complete
MNGSMTTKPLVAIITQRDSSNICRPVYMAEKQYEQWKYIKQNHNGNYYLTNLIRALYDLAACPGGRTHTGIQHKTFGPFIMRYSLAQEDRIELIAFKVDQSLVKVGTQAPALYRSEWDDEEKNWDTEDYQYQNMDLTHQWKGAHTAAIPGKFEDKEEAGEVIGYHITKAYRAAFSASEVQAQGNHFSLFWMNNEFKDRAHVESIVSFIQQAKLNNASVRWLIHGEAAGVFVDAVKYLNTQQQAGALKDTASNLVKQSVFFSNPRGKDCREQQLEALCEKVGLNYVGTKINDYDILFNGDARDKFSDKAITAGSIMGLSGVTGYVGYTALSNGYDAIMAGSSIATTMVAGTSAYFLAKDKATTFGGYARNLPKVVSSAFGKGNQQWH